MNSETNVTSIHRGLFAALRDRLAQRPDSEHAQAFIRLVIAIIGLLYVLFMNFTGKLASTQHHIIFFLASYAVLAVAALFVVILSAPQISPVRRLLGMICDLGGTSYFMHVMEGNGILFFPVYLWVTIGNGLRYGLRYLYLAMTISITGFMIVISQSDYWKEQWGFSIGLVVGLVALPLYFSTLLKQLNRQHDELKKLYEQMAKYATQDSLTNLPNRKHFHDQLEKAIASSGQDKRTFTLLYLDLDGFKAINDALGHAVGDQLIESTARRIEQCVRKDDMVARVGGDEFVVLLRDVASHDVSKIAEKIIENTSKPLALADKTLSITTSIGVATYPQDGADVNTLIHSADSAMYEAKRNGKNGYRIFRNKHAQPAPISINGLAN